ncbi:hypothetical protein TIFTF001_016200 [Ficus carica]|uniref:Retrotransposon gag domain-containing protein n=1 Tax=Ficus carica TaxID=3494 RepID=A0AA88AJ33_FICCA|nr:hypothetical protein TIFTF001_016200 [Ficus carica]
MRDEYFDNASTTSQIPHLEGDLRDHLRARRREHMHLENKAEPKHTHSFTQEITDVPLPERFKMPHMALYKGNPDDHIEIYIGHMNLCGIPEAIQCREFRTTLDGGAKRWFKQLLDPNESLKDWLHRYTTEVASMEDITKREVIMGALSSMRTSHLEGINAEEIGRLTHNEASQVNNPPNNNADQSLGRQNNKRGIDDNNDNAENATRRGQNHSSNPPEVLTSMLSP